MRVGIIQSNYLPWRGYFDFIGSVDLFVVHDDLQFTKGDWRNRNLVKTPKGVKWITVPVSYKRTTQRIDETGIDYSQKWAGRHAALIEANYRRTPYYERYKAKYETLLAREYASISELNVALIRWVLGELKIDTPLIMSRDLDISGAKTERLITLLKKIGATTYVSGPAAKAYLDAELFRENGIVLEYKTYDYPEYPQINGPFAGNVSIVDLLCNCGPESCKYTHSLAPNEIVLP
jgi:hypothetical protein